MLVALFDARIPPPIPVKWRTRFLIERDRRLLNITCILSRFWPKTLTFEQSVRGRTFAERISAGIPELINSVTTMNEAVEEAAIRWQKKSNLLEARELFRLEQSVRGGYGLDPIRPTKRQLRTISRLGISNAKIMQFQIDVITLAQSVEYLMNHHALPDMYARICPRDIPTRLVFGVWQGRRVIVPMD